jgi:hypothetical protein
MNELMDRFKQIPPWGYAVIAIGVLFLAYFTKNKTGASTGTTPIIQSVDPSVATYNNDAEQRMTSMYNNLESQLMEYTNQLNPVQNTAQVFTLQTGAYSDWQGAKAAQDYLISQGMGATQIESFKSNGWKGDQTYYQVKGYTPDQNVVLDSSNKLRQNGLAMNVYTGSTSESNAPSMGTHSS